MGRNGVKSVMKPVPMGFNRQSSERKWPERARGTKGSQQNLEGQSWSLCVRIKGAMCTHPGLGRHAYLAERTPMHMHSEILCQRVRSLRHGFSTVITGKSALGPGDSRFLKRSFNPSWWITDSNAGQSSALGPGDNRFLKSSFNN
ncbi:hypothetical protein PIB30_066240 [Stylosanthes scabra]|uniref:Uncharacterized protein n=1 Tax=Stylosanthes scabra TaxID=79078 RepID=A0ABU6VKT7_9FABA|nr:hypothetical protein [Stylosanthes scabra]